jgi:hypothetical protein
MNNGDIEILNEGIGSGATVTGIYMPVIRQAGSEGRAGTDVRIFKNIFAENFSEKIGVFDSKQS